eukprot:TRINITY_DN16830_c0_g2_i2.p1 TRINITY_DN16830_c0_g2~~TRINITY_DN16830_c0_g2_i2.p1  ORF type:complete len:199 (-),score=9.17 TRINITY_DN16830_c0_g2_i2:327-923(-)
MCRHRRFLCSAESCFVCRKHQDRIAPSHSLSLVSLFHSQIRLRNLMMSWFSLVIGSTAVGTAGHGLSVREFSSSLTPPVDGRAAYSAANFSRPASAGVSMPCTPVGVCSPCTASSHPSPGTASVASAASAASPAASEESAAAAAAAVAAAIDDCDNFEFELCPDASAFSNLFTPTDGDVLAFDDALLFDDHTFLSPRH